MSDGARYSCITNFGEELEELTYSGLSNWLISFRPLSTIYKAHFSYFVVFFTILGCGILSYRHSVENGKKFTQFWWGALLHGIFRERTFTATKYWHAQAPIMFCGKQLPLHIVLFYPSVTYVSTLAIQRLKLNKFVEPAAVGLLVMLMEIPFKMISVKFLHITYHDTDPLYYHKFCGVPWVEIFSSLTLASSFAAVYHLAHYYSTKDISKIWNDSEPTKNAKIITILSALGSQVFGFLQKVFLFHVFYDFFNVNPISCWFLTVTLYLSFIISFESKNARKSAAEDIKAKTFLFYQIVIYFGCLIYLALLGKPQNEVSIGLHEPTGDCTTTICSRTPLGKPLRRKKYLCADEVAARKNFLYTFECLEEGPPCLNAIWYTICGSKIYNKVQFFLNILGFIIFMWSVYFKLIFNDLKVRECLQKLLNILKRECPQPSASLFRNYSHAVSREANQGLFKDATAASSRDISQASQKDPNQMITPQASSSTEENQLEPLSFKQEQKDEKRQKENKDEKFFKEVKESPEKMSGVSIPDEVTVGFVFIHKNNPLFTLNTRYIRKK